jgi:hypothetical protein
MSAQDNVAGARAFVEAFNAHGLGAMAALATEEAAVTMPLVRPSTDVSAVSKPPRAL